MFYTMVISKREIRSEETNVYRVPSINFISAKRVWMFYNPCLAKFIRKLDLDVIHTYAEFSLGIFRRAMAREKNYAMI